MARRVPSGQLPLFDELPKAPAPLPPLLREVAAVDDDTPTSDVSDIFTLADPLAALPPSESPIDHTDLGDGLVLAVPVSSKSGGSVLSAIRQVVPPVVIEDSVLFSLHMSVLDFGHYDGVEADERELIVEACGSIEMRRFEALFASIGSRDEGGPALFSDDGGLGVLADCLRGALRERGAPVAEFDRNGPHVPLGAGTDDISTVALDRPLRLPVREFALLRVFGAGDGYEILRKWALAP